MSRTRRTIQPGKAILTIAVTATAASCTGFFGAAAVAGHGAMLITLAAAVAGGFLTAGIVAIQHRRRKPSA